MTYKQLKLKAKLYPCEASEFAAKYTNAADLMSALDAAGINSNQDWDEETTTWDFYDGSSITISGGDVSIDDGRESRAYEQAIDEVCGFDPADRSTERPYWAGDAVIDGNGYRLTEQEFHAIHARAAEILDQAP